ncbi:hypothetical protein JET97_14155 [Pseudomonas aeruginosa]|nr:hypothetical protein [Pseudomonas aeruginosa]MBI7032015.1 hypothetical protein [Pseudomonas aeruginosa]MBI7190597.1 hypothetical protein [Pseudomonas aeruginosa]MBI7207817.1 hypothetical protein [Pseudomonas aeruginosa]HCF7645825.1 hypothetical protein [Pseudomonas aeruginosa]
MSMEMNKAPVEQAGGDERAAFERAFTVQEGICFDDKRGEYRSMNLRAIEATDAQDLNLRLQGWQARAALASTPVADESPMAKMADALREKARQEQQAYQDRRNQATEWGPMPEGTEADRLISTDPVAHVAGDETSRYLEWAKDRSAWEMPVGTPVYYAALAQPCPARPEVVAFIDTATDNKVHFHATAWDQRHRLNGAELMTVAQHDRIVGELRADRDSWAEQAEQRLADWDEMRKERDAALARVAELPSLTEGELEDLREFHLAVCCDAGHRVEKDGMRRLAEIGAVESVGFGKHRLTEFGQYLLGIKHPNVAQAQHSVPEGLAEFSQFLSAVMDAAGLVRYGRRSKELSEYLGAQCMKYRLSAPVAQAQHSGPEEFSFEYRHPNGESHTVTVSRDQVISEMPDFLLEALCSKFCNCEPVGETNVVECCCDEYAEEFKLLAAAPGKEVPQAWLDVQAERRRQVEVEGYHGFRDNHYISYELSKAARAYIEVSWHALSGGLPCKKPESWPWMAGFKWSDGRTMLVKAGALILAEIERLDRAAPGKEGV